MWSRIDPGHGPVMGGEAADECLGESWDLWAHPTKGHCR